MGRRWRLEKQGPSSNKGRKSEGGGVARGLGEGRSQAGPQDSLRRHCRPISAQTASDRPGAGAPRAVGPPPPAPPPLREGTPPAPGRLGSPTPEGTPPTHTHTLGPTPEGNPQHIHTHTHSARPRRGTPNTHIHTRPDPGGDPPKPPPHTHTQLSRLPAGRSRRSKGSSGSERGSVPSV